MCITKCVFDGQAREIYEEGIQRVTTVRDFGQVFDAYAQFEESMINAKMETTAEMGPTEDGKGWPWLWEDCLMCVGVIEDRDLELRLDRFEELMDRRPYLLSR